MKLWQFYLFPKSSNQYWATSHSLPCSSCIFTKLSPVLRIEIRKIMLFPMSPDISHRIKVRRISRQKLDLYSTSGFLDKIAGQTALVDAKSVQNNKKIASDLAHQMYKELNNLEPSDRSGKQPEVKRPPNNASNRRNRFPIEEELKHGSLSP
jgi:hypothetical protein